MKKMCLVSKFTQYLGGNSGRNQALEAFWPSMLLGTQSTWTLVKSRHSITWGTRALRHSKSTFTLRQSMQFIDSDLVKKFDDCFKFVVGKSGIK